MEASSDRELLERIARQLYAWAEESQRGGWSTHQVEPQRRLADSIARHIVTHRETPNGK